jgi:hypothetical protein
MRNHWGELLVLIVGGTIADWLEKRKLKRKLREGLGRDVSEMELTSLTTWMRMPPCRSGPPLSGD